MAILQSVTYGGQTFEVPDKLSELSDVNVPANAANGSILTLQNGQWVPTSSVTNTKLTGLNASQSGAVTASDTVLSAIGKIAQSPRYSAVITNTVDVSDFIVQFVQFNGFTLVSAFGKILDTAATKGAFVKVGDFPSSVTPFNFEIAAPTLSGGLYTVRGYASADNNHEAALYIGSTRSNTALPDWTAPMGYQILA